MDGAAPRAELDLSGTWRAAPADDDLRRAYPDPAFDDDGWERIAVPGHWQSVPAFADDQGPVLYRTSFDRGPPAADERTWLTLDGCFYQGDVWLDGAYVGDTEGYFAPHSFEVTQLLADRGEHVLAVEVTCAPPTDLTAKRNVTGVLQHWDCLPPERNPGGLWRPVRVTTTGPVRIDTFRLVVVEADEDRAIVQIDASLDADAGCTVEVRTLVDPAGGDALATGSVAGSTDVTPTGSAATFTDVTPTGSAATFTDVTPTGSAATFTDVTPTGSVATFTDEHVLSAGTNQLTWRVAVEDPLLWWPRVLGGQPLHDVVVEVRVDDTPSDRTTRRVGLRQVSSRDWITTINGERLFLKGAVYGPTRVDLGAATDAELSRDLDLAAGAGLDFLRLIGHVAHPRLYDLADEQGMLLWQELPLQWGYARGIRDQAARQATAMVDTLGHHPSVFLWCGHNEPFTSDVRPGHRPDVEPSRRFLRRDLGAQELPGWNRTVLDRTVKRAIERADASRPTIAHSGVLPHPPQLDGTDTHLWFGWFHGRPTDLDVLAARLPRLVRFVSEFGAQSVPEQHPLPTEWPPDARALARLADAGLHIGVAGARLPFESQRSAEAWAEATRRHQGVVVKHTVETLRRLKYRPTGGFAAFMFADALPAVSAALLDHERRPKPAWDALRAACQPVIVVADPLPDPVGPGQEVHLAVHAVSDLRKPLDAAEVTATLSWEGERLDWRFGGDIGADTVVRIGTVRFEAPTEPGPLALDLTFTADGVTATNRYLGRVVR